MNPKALLIVLDGFGLGKDSPFNAINNAKMPFFRELIQKYPHSELLTHGEAVGLPHGVMGNSEVGHMTMGAGRIIYQDLVRINHAIESHELSKNKNLLQVLDSATANNGIVHFMGLLSNGGVHSHIDHLMALLDICVEKQIPKIALHLFLDGRDTPPHSSIDYVRTLLSHVTLKNGSAKIATISGRYFAMDRDKRWDRIEKAYLTLTGQTQKFEGDPKSNTPLALQAISYAHQNGQSDEFVEPLLLEPKYAMKSGDGVFFFNYRADRAREISEKILGSSSFKPSYFAGMTRYDEKINLPFAFAPQNLSHILTDCLAEQKLKQFRIAETEKYAHVTFFFNGGNETPAPGEDRLLIPSPKDVKTYDEKPEMSAFEVAHCAKEKLESKTYDFMLMNFANADMVGHTGNYAAAVKAMEALDACLAQVVGAAEKNGYHTLITADHGNCEEMEDSEGRPHTQHTLNPVPAIWVEPSSSITPKNFKKSLKDGTLADLMPTLCDLMKLPIPQEVTGQSLIPHSK